VDDIILIGSCLPCRAIAGIEDIVEVGKLSIAADDLFVGAGCLGAIEARGFC